MVHIFLWHVNFDFNFLVEKGAEQGLPETHILTASKRSIYVKISPLIPTFKDFGDNFKGIFFQERT